MFEHAGRIVSLLPQFIELGDHELLGFLREGSALPLPHLLEGDEQVQRHPLRAGGRGFYFLFLYYLLSLLLIGIRLCSVGVPLLFRRRSVGVVRALILFVIADG